MNSDSGAGAADKGTAPDGAQDEARRQAEQTVRSISRLEESNEPGDAPPGRDPSDTDE